MAVCIRHIETLATMDPALGEGPLGLVHDAALLLHGDRIAWLGSDAAAPDAEEVIDATGCAVVPGLVDCHTHAVWAGSRADEFERRLAGANYSDILEAGGGILSTVRATRSAGVVELERLAEGRLRALAARGTTTVEVKSGYGLSPEAEAQMLQVARRAAARVGITVRTTFLGAHALPPEWRSDRAGYVDEVVGAQLALAAPHADFVDVYVDRGAFTVDEGERILRAGVAAGLGLRIHAEQVEHTGAAAMAARLGALSCDHLERIDAVGIDAMAASGSVAVMLPGAMLYLRDASPPVGALREAGVPLAVATDLNPGSSPVGDLWACATLAAVTMRLTVEEALLGITAVAADALGLPERGRIRPGGPGDVVVVRPPAGERASPAVLVQYLGGARPVAVFASGRRL
ncbi:MAG: imidazolonepropionase [Myxococcota bacterium]|jgi:imidazolonepropionase